ncbi:MAG TPA: transcriptional regulator [Comamonadaceae bacterium]|nr:transcriptional regulator [Comamonadaceae bacterium]
MLYQARYVKLRDELAQMRLQAGMTQSELARRMGKAQSFVSKVETGERYVEVLDFLRWCEMSGTDAGLVLQRVKEVPA